MRRALVLVALALAIIPAAAADIQAPHALNVTVDSAGITVAAKKLQPNTSYALSCVIAGYHVGSGSDVTNARGKVVLSMPLPAFLEGQDFLCWVRAGDVFGDPVVILTNGKAAAFSGP